MFVVFGGLFFILFGRILFIQMTGQVDGRELAKIAANQYEKHAVLQANRGAIVDRNDEPIASDTLSYHVVAVLNEAASKNSKKKYHVIDYKETAKVLAKYLPLTEREIYDKMKNAREGTWQIEFGRAGKDLNRETVLKMKEELDRKGLSGILFVEGKKRFYPNGRFASYLVGFAQKEETADRNTVTTGKMGLEKTYNKQLTGVDGKVNYQADGWGYLLPTASKQIEEPKDGQTIKLTLDKTISNFVEEAMDKVEKEYSPKKMLVLVTNPKTGEILAMSQRPTFNPMTREGLTENWLNDAVEQTIEPGSPMKMFTLATAVEEGKWAPDDYFKSGSYQIYDRIIRDVNVDGWGTITFLEGLQRSSNVGMAYLLERIGDQKFIEYIHKFGFGKRTGIDLPNEASGVVLDNYPAERLTTSYGQGSTVTPLQMIQAASAIANDGVMMKPYVIDQIIDPNTEEVLENHEPEESGKPISAETAKQVREILASTVTSENGTAQKYHLENYAVGGKTGTAEIPKKEGKGYMSGYGNYLYSFLGMAPIDDPQLLIYVTVQQPKLKGGELGSDPVSKVFNPIMENSLKYLNIAPDDEQVIPVKKVGDYEGEEAEKAAELAAEDGFQTVLIGEGGKVSKQIPKAKTKLTEDSIILLKTEGDTTFPDMTGWSKKMVLSFTNLSKLDIRINGEGYVVGQSVTEGTSVNKEDPVVVELRTPEQQFNKKKNKENKEEGEEEQIMGG
ncbi:MULTISPECIES: penicillin-binding transpeptidase domain-containing protein [unclassified Sporosarcina]|uniref:penicillin-binding transpeptidase domain-containing protein n=1 Tax=unclassified Sporosarcina TaxID=2647733 RepID=UPI001E4CD426|nr:MULTISPECIES: penicillin-binding transpeptidase domain-containing protein [unclassified Sporosarcina]